MMKWTIRAVMLLATLLVVAACNGEEANDTTADVDAEALVESAASALEDTSAFEIVLETSGTPVQLDAGAIDFAMPIMFERAEGVYVAPNRLGGTVSLRIEDAVTDANVIVVGDDQYVRHVLITLNNWQELIFSEGFNPANLTSGDESIPAALRDIQNLEYLGRTALDGIEMHHLRGEVDAIQVSAATVGLIGTEEGLIEAELFIRPGDERLEELRLEEPIPDEDTEPTQWTISFFSYGGDFTVNQPDVSP
ncbi:MAG: LppX_LprAFG lipoprotein [Anaerolineales bacterium]